MKQKTANKPCSALKYGSQTKQESGMICQQVTKTQQQRQNMHNI